MIGTTPAGAVVTEGEPAKKRIRWHKLLATLATQALLTAVTWYAIRLLHDGAAMMLVTYGAASTANLAIFITGNVKEHQAQSAIGGIVSAAMGKLAGVKK